MSLSDEQSAYIPLKMRTEWEDRLLNSSRYTCCRRGPNGPERPGECEEWDDSYNTSDDPEINSLRQADQANYAVWIHEFANRLDAGTEQALQALQNAGACMPCIGRMIYAYLRGEYLASYLEPQPLLRKLRGTAAFPAGLMKVRGRRSLIRKRAQQNFASLLLVTAIKGQCSGRAHCEKLAILLNHGKSCPSPLQGGFFAPTRFPSIDTAFTERLLRYRAWRGDPHYYSQTVLSLPFEKVRDLSRFMQSRGE
jgi:hypothetical protein